MNYFNIFEILFLFVARCLGVKFLKKYWIIHGSYWKNKHIKPNSEKDLVNVIKYTYIHSRNHTIIIFIEILIYLFITKSAPLFYLFFSSIIHLYAFMIQLYNFICAKNAIRCIK